MDLNERDYILQKECFIGKFELKGVCCDTFLSFFEHYEDYFLCQIFVGDYWKTFKSNYLSDRDNSTVLLSDGENSLFELACSEDPSCSCGHNITNPTTRGLKFILTSLVYAEIVRCLYFDVSKHGLFREAGETVRLKEFFSATHHQQISDNYWNEGVVDLKAFSYIHRLNSEFSQKIKHCSLKARFFDLI